MADGRKATPEPLEEPESLERKLERAAREDVDPRLRVSLVVAGGAPSQRYRFHFAADGSGGLRCELEDELGGRSGRTSRRALARKDFAGLVRTVVESGVLDVPARQPRFLPDTVIGTLELADERTRLRWDFAADPEQARTQDAAPPPAVTKATDEIYALGLRLMRGRMDSIKP